MATTLAALAWWALILQLGLSMRLTLANGKSIGMGLIVFFGFFTILTNLLVAVTLSLQQGAASRTRAGRFFTRPSVLAGVATSIALVGLGYHVLIREVWSPQGMQWVADLLLHYIVPAAYVAWWLVAAPKDGLTLTSPLRWAVWPIAYFAYALIRGALTGLYAYPFIDVPAIGYPQALLNSLGLLVAFVLLGLVFVAIARIAPARTRTS